MSSAAFTAMISQALNNFGGQTMQARQMKCFISWKRKIAERSCFHVFSPNTWGLEALIPVTTMWPITSRTQPGPKACLFVLWVFFHLFVCILWAFQYVLCSFHTQLFEAAAKFKIGDGGHMDNSGLLPILQRKVGYAKCRRLDLTPQTV